jgi:hypothetical protein
MSIVILNESGSKIEMEKEPLLIWAAVLIAKKTYLSGILGIPLDFERSFNLADEVKKVSAAERIYPLMANPHKNPRLKDVESHFDKNYSRLKLLRKKRKKNKAELLELIKREDILRKHFKLTEEFFLRVREYNCIVDLPRFTGDDENDLVTVHCLNSDYDDEKFTGYPVEPLTESFLSDEEFHLFSEAVEGLLTEKSEGLPYFTAFKFINLPAVTELKENQIFMLIEKLESVKQTIEERLIRTQEVLKTLTYEKDNENVLTDIISNNVLRDKDFFENTIAECIYDSTDFTKKDGVNELYLCVCSYENMIDVYKHLNVYKDEIIYSYVKDNVSKNIGLRMSRLFLYLKTD